ncbi:unnamed protein product [Aphanomyces euteiches]
MIRRQQEAIISYGVLNSCPEPTVQRLLALAALICSTPISCLYLVDWDAKRVYTRAVVGHEIHTVNISFDENSSNHTFCLRCIGGCKREDGGVSETPLIVNNTELHVDFRNNEYVREGLVKFYLGVPLLTPSGLPIGAFCIIDSKARTIPSKDIHALTLLARQVMGHFEYLREACILANRLAEREALRFRLRLVLGGMLPRHFATSIKRGLKPTTDFFDPVTVFFSDIVGFKKMCATTPPMTVLHMLDTLYTSMDRLVVKHGLFKVETIGDVFLCCGGMLKPQADHTLRIAKFAVDAIEAASKVIRVGIHTGAIVASVAGTSQPRYCVFGDTVNTAARIQTSSRAGRINMSRASASALKTQCPHALWKERPSMFIKGKGDMIMYFLDSLSVNAPRESDEHQVFPAKCFKQGIALTWPTRRKTVVVMPTDCISRPVA